MNSLSWQWQVGLAFARNAFLNLLAYRLRYLVGVANYFLYVSVNYFLMKAVLIANPDAMPNLNSGEALATYFAIAWAIRAAYFNSIDSLIAEKVSSGEIAMELVRPTSYLWMKYMENMGETCFRLFFMSLPILAVLVLIYYPLIQGPESSISFLYFLLSILCAFHVYFAINFLTGLIAFVTMKIQGFLWAKFFLVQLLSGVMIPLELFKGTVPAWFLSVLHYSPFASLGSVPLMLYQGHVPTHEMHNLLLIQVIWAVALLFFCHVCWKLALRKVVIQGG